MKTELPMEFVCILFNVFPPDRLNTDQFCLAYILPTSAVLNQGRVRVDRKRNPNIRPMHLT